VLFDTDRPASRDFTETVRTVAHLARFIIADLSEPRSVPQELQAIAPTLLSVPIQPIIVATEEPYGMFADFARYPQVLPVVRYRDIADLLETLPTIVANVAERGSVVRPLDVPTT
jgi:hypothetical protein